MAKIQRYFWDGTKWEPEEHTHNTSDITAGTLGVARGGTGLSTVTSNSYLKGNGTGALVPRTYTQVKNDLALNNVENKTSATIRGEITKAEIEAKLTGLITSHSHNYAGSSSAGGPSTSLLNFITTTTTSLGVDVNTSGIGYISTSLLGQSDGALYTHVYSTSWKHQIFGDYRTGQIAIRGKNNGTWQAWRTVRDTSNFVSGTGSGNYCAGNDSRLTNARPASDVLAWAKIGNGDTIPTSKLPDFVRADGNVGNENHINLGTASSDSFVDVRLGKRFGGGHAMYLGGEDGLAEMFLSLDLYEGAWVPDGKMSQGTSVVNKNYVDKRDRVKLLRARSGITALTIHSNSAVTGVGSQLVRGDTIMFEVLGASTITAGTPKVLTETVSSTANSASEERSVTFTTWTGSVMKVYSLSVALISGALTFGNMNVMTMSKSGTNMNITNGTWTAYIGRIWKVDGSVI